MNKWLILMLIGVSGLCSACDPEGDKIRDEIEHIAGGEKETE